MTTQTQKTTVLQIDAPADKTLIEQYLDIRSSWRERGLTIDTVSKAEQDQLGRLFDEIERLAGLGRHEIVLIANLRRYGIFKDIDSYCDSLIRQYKLPGTPEFNSYKNCLYNNRINIDYGALSDVTLQAAANHLWDLIKYNQYKNEYYIPQLKKAAKELTTRAARRNKAHISNGTEAIASAGGTV